MIVSKAMTFIVIHHPSISRWYLFWCLVRTYNKVKRLVSQPELEKHWKLCHSLCKSTKLLGDKGQLLGLNQYRNTLLVTPCHVRRESFCELFMPTFLFTIFHIDCNPPSVLTSLCVTGYFIVSWPHFRHLDNRTPCCSVCHTRGTWFLHLQYDRTHHLCAETTAHYNCLRPGALEDVAPSLLVTETKVTVNGKQLFGPRADNPAYINRA